MKCSRIAGLVLTVGLAGCAVQTVPFSTAQAVPADRLYAFQDAGPGLVQVRVTRDQGGTVGAFVLDDIMIDGKKAAEIDTGEKVTFYLTPGPHNMGVKTREMDHVLDEHQYIIQPNLPNRYHVWHVDQGPQILPVSVED